MCPHHCANAASPKVARQCWPRGQQSSRGVRSKTAAASAAASPAAVLPLSCRRSLHVRWSRLDSSYPIYPAIAYWAKWLRGRTPLRPRLMMNLRRLAAVCCLVRVAVDEGSMLNGVGRALWINSSLVGRGLGRVSWVFLVAPWCAQCSAVGHLQQHAHSPGLSSPSSCSKPQLHSTRLGMHIHE